MPASLTDKPKFTKGPWNVLLHSDGELVLNVIAGEAQYDSGQTTATWIAELDGSNLDGEDGENEANAALIAAAPDLYDAIVNSDDAHWTPAMRAALAKARGEQS